MLVGFYEMRIRSHTRVSGHGTCLLFGLQEYRACIEESESNTYFLMSALTINFTNIIAGQHAVDEYFWRRQSLVALEREIQESIKEKTREVLTSTMSEVQSLSVVIAIRA